MSADAQAHPRIAPNVNALEFDPTLAGILAGDRVTRVELPYGAPGPWLVSRYDDIRAITNDRRFARAPLKGEVEIPRLMPAFTPPPDAVQLQDPPRASDLREAMGKGITSRRMRKFSATADEIVAALLDRIDPAAGPVDLMTALTGRVPLDVMSTLLGIPDADRADIRRWTLDMFSTRPENGERSLAAKHGLGHYAAGLMADRREHPGNDPLTRMVTGPAFTDGELIGMTIQMIAVGIAPGNALLSNVVYLLLTRDDLAHVRREPGRIADHFSELARYVPVIQGFGPPLVATTDVRIGETTIRKGEVVVYSYTSGNHDPGTFDDPDTIDLTRRDVKHFTFGAGLHACVGQHFTRMVVTSAITGLFTRFPDLRLAVPADEIDWDNGTIWRHPVRLPVHVRADPEESRR